MPWKILQNTGSICSFYPQQETGEEKCSVDWVGENPGGLTLTKSESGAEVKAAFVRHRCSGHRGSRPIATLLDRQLRVRTPFVFVGNNEYVFNALRFGKRTSLVGGQLGLYTTRRRDRLSMFSLATKALLGTLKSDRDFKHWLLPAAEIDSSSSGVWVALDGEVASFTLPLKYRILPQALVVKAPG